jgi:hypothetical protein
MLQWRAWLGDFTGDLGLALAHPLYVAAAHLAGRLGGRNFAFAMNFFTGLGTAVALANLACVTAVVTGRRWIGLATSAMLGVAHTVWWLSTIVEAGYTWGIAGLTAELWLLVALLRRPRWQMLAALAFVNGLGLCVHNLALLPLPVYVVAAAVLAARKELPKRSLAAAAVAYVLGAGVYIGMIIELAARTGSIPGAIGSALFGDKSLYAGAVLSTTGNWRFLKYNAVIGALNFVSLLLPLAVVGWIRLRRRLGGMLSAAIAAITLIEAIFVVRYPVPDQFMFLLPTLVMVALAAGVGAAVLAEASRRWRVIAIAACAISVVMPPVFCAAGPSLARAVGVNIERAQRAPRDELRYWMVPWKHNEDSAERFAAAALKAAEPDGVIAANKTTAYVLMIVQRRDNVGRGVSVHFYSQLLSSYKSNPKEFRRALGSRPLYLVFHSMAGAEMEKDADPVPIKGGILWQVRWHKS